MLRKLRVTLAVILFTLITILFLDFTGATYLYLNWLAKVQFLPAVLTGSFGIVILLVAVTLLFGRVYCSVVCPLGIMQDGFSWLGGKVKKNRFHFKRAITWLRWTIVGIFVVLFIVGLNQIALIIAPYSAYGRIAASIFQPVYMWVNNLLAALADRAGNYTFYHVDVWIKSATTLIVAAATFLVVGFMAFRGGRTWCNTICPVGTVLGVFSKFALFKPTINTERCNGCQRCARNCKASCINPETHQIDYSRCVTCMDCIGNCKQGAIEYRLCTKTAKSCNPSEPSQKSNSETSRRQFLAVAAMAATASTLHAQEKKIDGGLAVIEDKKIIERKTPIHPAGSVSLKNFASHCTACQLCVSNCPNDVLRPARDLSHFMQPEMMYDHGYCSPDCTRCSEVCPTGAIVKITPDQKSAIHIGLAIVELKNCIANADGVKCGNCARHCPANAIIMVPKNPGDNPDLAMTIKIPTIDESRCTGCGMCENLCPARPFSAIYVEGRADHIIR